MFQIAPRSLGGMANPDAIYAPQRDLAHVFPRCIAYVAEALKVDNRPAWVARHCKINGIDEEALADGLKRLIDATRLFHDAAKFPSENEALEETGFTELDPAVQHAIFSVVGRYFVAGFCSAIRDLTIAGQNPAKAAILAELADRIDRAQQHMDAGGKQADEGDTS